MCHCFQFEFESLFLICIIISKSTSLQYKQASSVLSVGSIRQQFSIPQNTQMSMFSSDFIQNIDKHLTVEENDPPDVQFVNGGYLLLASNEGVSVLRENYQAQRGQGAFVELLEPFQLKARYPWMNIDGIALGSLGTCVCIFQVCLCVCVSVCSG